jgi:transcriptional regulator with XRE-family HTH domain
MPARGVALPGLRAARTRRLLTQAALAERSGVGRNTIARIETGDLAAFATVSKLAAALEVAPEILMGPGASEAGEGKARAA